MYNYNTLIISNFYRFRKEMLVLIALFATGFLSRIFFVEKMQSHWDGPQYSIAVVRYSLLEQTPALPGYPIYIGLGKLLYAFVRDPHYSIVFLSVLFSGIGACIFYLVGKVFTNHRTGIIVSLLFLSSPVFYFFGLTANPYGIVGMNSALFALVTYLIVSKNKRWGIAYGLLFAYVVGFRPQEILFLTPLWLYGVSMLPSNERVKAFLLFFLGSFLWICPTALTVGGIFKYFQLVLNNISQSTSASFIGHEINVLKIIIKGLFLTFGISVIVLFFVSNKIKMNRKLTKDKRTIIFILWILPSFLFNVFVRSDHAAHQVTYLSGLLVLISISLYILTKKLNSAFLYIILAIIVLFNLFTFFRDRDPQYKKPYIPQSYHFSEIKKNDKKMSAKVQYIKDKTQSKNTFIIVGDPDYIRPVMYHLPAYTVIQITRLFSEDIHFKDVLRTAKDFKMKEEIYKKNTFIVPKEFTNVVCFDDNCSMWMKERGIKLKGNSLLVSKVITNHEIYYSFNRLIIK